MRPTLYLCGPFTGHEEEAYKAFAEAEDQLIDLGYHVENPLRSTAPGMEWHAAMRVAIGIMTRCTGVALLDGWDESRGACIERALADDLDIPVASLDVWKRGCTS